MRTAPYSRSRQIEKKNMSSYMADNDVRSHWQRFVEKRIILLSIGCPAQRFLGTECIQEKGGKKMCKHMVPEKF
jgi:hypothetical protein